MTVDREPTLVPFRDVDGRALHLHVWSPDPGVVDPSGAPMVLDLHGGAWTHFTPAVDRFWCRRLAERGVLVASAEMRLSGEAVYPACADDARAAAVWLRTHGAELGGDPTRLAVLGGSTGGHLALVAALDPWPGGDVDAVLALWPVVDVAARYEMVTTAEFSPFARRVADRLARRSSSSDGATGDPAADQLAALDRFRRRHPMLGDAAGAAAQAGNLLIGLLPPARAGLYRELAAAHEQTFPATDGAGADGVAMVAASAVTLLARRPADLPPPSLLIVQGRRDPNITVAASERLVAEWRAAGAMAELFVVDGVGHSFGNIPSRRADALVCCLLAAIGHLAAKADA